MKEVELNKKELNKRLLSKLANPAVVHFYVWVLQGEATSPPPPSPVPLTAGRFLCPWSLRALLIRSAPIYFWAPPSSTARLASEPPERVRPPPRPGPSACPRAAAADLPRPVLPSLPSGYRHNSPHANRAVVCMLARIADPEQLDCEAMLYQLSVLRVFHKVRLLNSGSYSDRAGRKGRGRSRGISRWKGFRT